MALAFFSRLRAERLRKIFWILAILAVFINLYDDVHIFIRNQIGNKNAAWVDKSFRERHDFERLISLFFSEQWNTPETKAEAEKILSSLRASEATNPQALSALDRIEETLKFPPDHDLHAALRMYRPVVQSMRSLLDRSMQVHVDRDLNDSAKNEAVVFAANIVDLVLIFLLLGVYFLERSVKDEIESALSRSVNDLRASNASLEALTSSRARQLRVAAHDIKSPLTALKGYSEIVRESLTSDQPIFRLLQRMDTLTNSTLEMVNTLFKNETAAEPMADVSIDSVLAEVCAGSNALAQKKNQKLEFTGEGSAAVIQGRRPELLTCFYNLLNNAIKFSPSGARIKIDWKTDDTHVSVSITDEGPGFKPQDFLHLFEEGAVLSARPTAGEKSSGYGLYSTKKIIEEHRGSIQVHNCGQGLGAVVAVDLPKSANAP